MNNINFELYRVFYYVSKYKNITRASNELYISQPAVTQSIKKLEDQIEYKLFYRTKKGMELTNEGQILYEYIKTSIETLINCKDKIIEQTELNSKVIRIGSGITLIKSTLIKPLQIFKKMFPNVKVEIFHGIHDELLDMLSNGLLDMVLMNLPAESNENVKVYKIEDVKDIFVAKTSVFGEYKNKKFSFDELNQLPLVFQQEKSTARKFLDGLMNKNNSNLSPEYELGSYSLVLDFIKEGIGVGFVNKKHVKEELDSNELFEVKIDFNIPSREIGVAINKKSISNKTINKFIEIMKDN